MSLSIAGQNLSNTSAVSWTTPYGRTVKIGADLIQAARVAATIPSALLSTAGTAQVALTDGTGVLSNQLPFVISPALGISTASLPNGTVGTVYGPGALSASGGSTPYTWTLTGGALPDGLSMDLGGALSGTPQKAGGFGFGVKVTDNRGATAAASVVMSIAPLSLKIITSATLPSGIAGAEYPNQILSASGGTPTYKFSGQGTLPAGLTLSNGQIGGTPTTAGTTTFTLVVTDSGSVPATATSSEQITIKAPQADLVAGSSSAAFSIANGTSEAPPPIVIPIGSSVAAQVLNFSTAIAPSVPWLSVSAGTSCPAAPHPPASALAFRALPCRWRLPRRPIRRRSL